MVVKPANADMALRPEAFPWSCDTTAGHHHLYVVCRTQRGNVMERS